MYLYTTINTDLTIWGIYSLKLDANVRSLNGYKLSLTVPQRLTLHLCHKLSLKLVLMSHVR